MKEPLSIKNFREILDKYVDLTDDDIIEIRMLLYRKLEAGGVNVEGMFG